MELKLSLKDLIVFILIIGLIVFCVVIYKDTQVVKAYAQINQNTANIKAVVNVVNKMIPATTPQVKQPEQK